jgi:hypothetical protein
MLERTVSFLLRRSQGTPFERWLASIAIWDLASSNIVNVLSARAPTPLHTTVAIKQTKALNFMVNAFLCQVNLKVKQMKMLVMVPISKGRHVLFIPILGLASLEKPSQVPIHIPTKNFFTLVANSNF